MHPIHHAPMTGIVFRRLRSPAEREAAHRLLADGGAPPGPVRMPGETMLFGLWDLAAPNGGGLVAVAATQRLDDAGSVELGGIVVRADLRRRGLGRRLVTEVADALRAQGVAHLVVRLEGDHRSAAALLTRAGFAATTDAEVQSAGTEVDWLYLEL
jgi:GNAT superfamily N-acetyltransferase